MKTLIAYATNEGQTEAIARRIATGLRDAGEDGFLVNLKERAPDLSGFDQAVIGASMHAGGYQKAARNFVAANRDGLNRMPSWFISVCLTEAEAGHHDEVQPIIDAFLADTGWRPTGVKSWAGALKYSQYNWLMKRIMRRIVRSKGGYEDMSRDYDFTDWNAVDAFARELAAAGAREASAG
jgi:menaquinone-dependent protoporphyrinogen oxidase